MHPAALLARHRPYLTERLPEAECAVSNGEFRCNRKTAASPTESRLSDRKLKLTPDPFRHQDLAIARDAAVITKAIMKAMTEIVPPIPTEARIIIAPDFPI